MDWMKRPRSFLFSRTKDDNESWQSSTQLPIATERDNAGATSLVSRLSMSSFSFAASFKDHPVDENTQELLKMTRHAFTQVREAQRLRQLNNAELLENADLKVRNWVDSTIKDAEEATRDMAALIEPARVDQETRGEGGSHLGKRMLWALRNNTQRVEKKRSYLLLCLGSLAPVISYLHQLTYSEYHVVADDDQARPSLPTNFDEISQVNIGRHWAGSKNFSSSISLVLPSEVESLVSAEEMPRKGTQESIAINQEVSEMLSWRRSKQFDATKPQAQFVAELESIAPSER